MARQSLFITIMLMMACVIHADPPGDELEDKITKAYQAVNDYRSTVSLKVEQKQGRWTNVQSGEVYVGLDRAANQLSFDKPDMKLVIDQGKLMLNSPDLAGRHLDMAAPAMELEAITQVVPFIDRPMTPDLAFLTAKDPIAALGGEAGNVVALSPREGDAANRPGLQLTTEAGPLVLWLNPQTHLIEEAIQTLAAAAMGGSSGDGITITFKLDATVGEAAAEDLFRIDTTNSTAVATVKDLVGGNGPGQDGGEAEAALQDADAPEIELKTLDGKAFKLSEAKEKVIVLDFWATWCPPCREGLPKLQSVYDWARAEKKDVAIYAVNLQELPEQVKDYWTKGKFTMPVLMDLQGKASENYQVQSIPQTFIISGGKIARVHVGYDPAMADTLKKEIDELLAPVPENKTEDPAELPR